LRSPRLHNGAHRGSKEYWTKIILGQALDQLTTREHEVLEFVAQGLDNDAIGKQLRISKRTARNHVSLILSKLGVKSRAQAIVRARDAGFGRKTSG